MQAFSNVNNMHTTYENNASTCMRHSLSKAIYMFKFIFSLCRCLNLLESCLVLLSWNLAFALMDICLCCHGVLPLHHNNSL